MVKFEISSTPVFLSLFALTGAPVGERTHCVNGFCITLYEAREAEAGLCVVIPCSFSTPFFFIPQNMVWFKCEPSKQTCGDSEIIFHPNENNKKVQSGFKGRVSLLEPDVGLKDCSIIINDLTESDSGSYRLRFNGVINRRLDELSFPLRTNVSVKGMKSYNNYT